MADKTEKEYRTVLTELNKVLSDRTGAATSNRITLRDAVCAYVAVEQARGTTLKIVIETLKEILREAEQVAASATAATERRDDDLAQQLVAWCLEFVAAGRRMPI